MNKKVSKFMKMSSELATANEVGELWQKIDLTLSPILGMRGATALYNHCLRNVATSHPWLNAAWDARGTVIDFSSFKAALSQQTKQEITKTGKELLELFLSQLSTLIGPVLAERLLGEMPASSLDSALNGPVIDMKQSGSVSKSATLRAISSKNQKEFQEDNALLEQQILHSRWVLHKLEQKIIELNNQWKAEQSDLVSANESLVLTNLTSQAAINLHAKVLEEIKNTYSYDSLTGLPNRALSVDRLNMAIALAKRKSNRLAVLFLDLDKFKHINDDFGHDIGDKALQHVANILSMSIRAGDTASRHGGDEFLVILHEILKPSDALAIAEKISKSISLPVVLAEQQFCLAASIGISFYPDDGLDSDTLINAADKAMYLAKKEKETNLFI